MRALDGPPARLRRLRDGGTVATVVTVVSGTAGTSDLPLRLALTSVLSASVDRGGDRHGLLLAMQPAQPQQPAQPRRPAPRVPAPRRPLDDLPDRLAAVHPLRPQVPPGGDDPAAA